MSQLKKSAKSIGMIIIITLGSKVLGFFREALIASRYGSGVGTDTFFIALSVITLFSAIVTQTINTTLIPVLSDIEVNEGKIEKKKQFNNFLNTMTLLVVLLSILAYFLAPYTIRIIAKGFVGEQFNHAVYMMRMGLPIIIFSTIVGAFNGYLETEERFAESALSGYSWNIIYILFLIFIAERFSITALMVVAVVGEVSKLLIPIPGLKKLGYYYQFTIDLQDKYMRRMVYLLPPVLFSVGINDLNGIVDRSMASTLVEGSVSSLSYANTLNGIIDSVFVAAILTVVFPILSKEANAENYERFKRIINLSMNVVLLILIPATIGMIVLAEPAVRLAYQRGEFGERAAWMTQTALIAYSVGLVGMGIKSLLIRISYALQDTKIPMRNSVYTLVFNVVLNIIFVRFLGHNGLALATSLATIITACILLYDLRKKIGALGLSTMIQSTVRIMISSVIMGVVIYLIYNYSMSLFELTPLPELVLVVAIVGIGSLTYVGLLFLFKVEELQFLINNLKRKLGKEKQH